MRDIHEWYFNRIPENKDEFGVFLSKSYRMGHPQFKKYTTVSNVYAIPYSQDMACIPNWVFSTAWLDKNLSQHDQHALRTSFWNWSVLMNKGMWQTTSFKGNRILTQYHLTPQVTIGNFCFYLNEAQKLIESKFGLFAKTTLNAIYTSETLKKALHTLHEAPTVQHVGEVIEHFLNPTLRNALDDVVVKDISDILHALLNPELSTRKIIDLATQLWELLQNPPQEDEQPENKEDNTKEQEDTQEDLEQDSPSLEDILSEDTAEINIRLSSRQATDEEMLEALETMNEALLNGWGDTEGDGQVKVTDVMREEYTPGVIKETDVLSTLPRHIQQLKVNRNKPIQPNWYGAKLLGNQVWRVKSDLNILGTPAPKKVKVKKEWVIGCDASGSTYSAHRSNSLHLQILRAAKGALIALRDAGETASVYAHTSEWNYTHIIPIATHLDTNISERFDRAANIDHNENFDYAALEWFRRRAFIHNDSVKLVIMLSDGQPCPVGRLGTERLIEEVNTARKRGVVVFSVSLTRDVVGKNEVIYGKEWNVDASRGDIEEQLKRIIVRVTEEYSSFSR